MNCCLIVLVLLFLRYLYYATLNASTNDGLETPGLKEIDFEPYLHDMHEKIKEAWCPPSEKVPRTAVVSFKIHHDGSFSDLYLKLSSDSKAMDYSSLLAIKTAAPFATLPRGYPKTLDIVFTFEYKVANSLSLTHQQENATLTQAHISATAVSAYEQLRIARLLKELADLLTKQGNHSNAGALYKKAAFMEQTARSGSQAGDNKGTQ